MTPELSGQWRTVPLSGRFAARALGGPGVRLGRPCACGAPATTALPYLSEWACLHCTIAYYTGLVAIGAASFRAGNYAFAEPDADDPGYRYQRVCRVCTVGFGTNRPNGRLCVACVSAAHSGNRRGRRWPVLAPTAGAA